MPAKASALAVDDRPPGGGAAADRGPLDICVLGVASSPHVMARAAAFARLGHKVELISPVSVETAQVATSFPNVANLNGAASVLYALAWTAWRLVRTRAQVYHAHYAADIGSWLAWLLRKRPLVVSVMGGDVLFEEQGSVGVIGRWLTRRALKAAALVTVKTPQLADVVAGFGVPRDRIETVIWGVDLNVFAWSPDVGRDYRLRLGIPADGRVVYSPRMLMPFYRIDILVEAWPQVVKSIPGAVLVLSTFNADAAYRRKLENRAADLGVGQSVVFAPPLALGDMPAAYSAADVVVSIPPSDGFPQTALEAAACQRPLVLSDLPRLHDFFVPGQDAVYTTADPDSVAAAVIRNLADPAAAASRAARALEKVRSSADLGSNAARVEARMHHLLSLGL